MRTIFAIVLVLSCHLANAEEIKSAVLYVERIQCVVCAAAVQKALNVVPGVKTVTVDVENKVVVVQFDAGKTSAVELADATKKRGFAAEIRKVE